MVVIVIGKIQWLTCQLPNDVCERRVDVSSEPDVLGTGPETNGVTGCVKVRVGYYYAVTPKAATHCSCIRLCILGGYRVDVVF